MSATETIPDDGDVAPGQARVAAPDERPARVERTSTPKPAKEPKPPKETRHSRQAPRTTRVVLRKLDAWSVLKLSLVFYLALFVVILVAGVLLWLGATAAGVIGNVEHFMEDIGFNDFKFVPDKLLGGFALGGLALVVAGTCANVLLAALFNLMGDIVGGLKLTLQEDREEPPRAKPKDEGNATV